MLGYWDIIIVLKTYMEGSMSKVMKNSDHDSQLSIMIVNCLGGMALKLLLHVLFGC